MPDELKKWLPAGTDGRIQSAKELTRLLMQLFAVMWFARMAGVDFSRVQLPLPFGITLDPQVHWGWFMFCTIVCGALTNRLSVAQDEHRAVNGTGSGSKPPAPPVA